MRIVLSQRATSLPVVQDYNAEQEDEISVKFGDAVDIIATNARGTSNFSFDSKKALKAGSRCIDNCEFALARYVSRSPARQLLNSGR